jgi:predicted metalloprotease with PDZ domain
VRVNRVKHGAARDSGLKSGDIIIEIQGRTISSPDHYRDMMSTSTRAKKPYISVMFIRDNQVRETKIWLDNNTSTQFETAHYPSTFCNYATMLPCPYQDIPCRINKVFKILRK